MIIIQTYQQLAPGTARKNYVQDWTRELEGGTLATAVWTVTPAGPTITAQTLTSTRSQCYLGGGTLGVDYSLTCTATKSGDAQYLEPRTMIVPCRLT